MKKDNKLIVLKSLIIAVFLILGNTALAQHPLLNPNELDVYAGPISTVTIGKQASDEGRTCYKWYGPFGDNGYEERIGSLQEFEMPLYMTPYSNYQFRLTVIGEQYYQQIVTLHVVGQVTFQVYPKKGCISGNEMPQIEDFDIITNPPGFENLVSIVGMHPHTQNVIDGYYDVFFNLTVNGAVLDQKSATIVNTDEMYYKWWVDLTKVNEFVQGMTKVIRFIFNAWGALPGAYVSLDMPQSYVFGLWTISRGMDCCSRPMSQMKVDIDNVGLKQEIEVAGGINIGLASFGIRGGLEYGANLGNIHIRVFETCIHDPSEFSITAYIEPFLGVYAEDITGGYVASAQANIKNRFTFNSFRIKFEPDGAEALGSVYANMYIEAKIKMMSLFEFNPKIQLYEGNVDLGTKVYY